MYERRTPAEDREAHNERNYREYLELIARAYPSSDTPNTRADGMPLDYLSNTHRTMRVSESSWNRGMYGRAQGFTRDASGAILPGTVRVTRADGSVEVVSHDSLRRRETRTTGRTSAVDHSASYEARAARFGYNSELAGE